MKKVLLIFLTSAILLCAGCDKVPPYEGEHDDLAATALHSIPGADSNYADNYFILEEDEYGRVMFGVDFCSSYLRDEEWSFFPRLFAVVIMQKSDEENVYFYAEQNYLLSPYETESDADRRTKDCVEQVFSEEQINALKEANDWGKPPESCSKNSIQVDRDEKKDSNLPNAEEAALDAIISSKQRWESVLRRDESGNTLCFVIKNHEYKTENENYKWYAVIFDANGNLQNGEESIMELTDINTFGQDIQKLLQKNSWKDATAP